MGRRKWLALLAAGLLAIAAVAAWRLWETEGLLAVLVAISVGGSLVLGWLMAQGERRMRGEMSKLQDGLKSMERARDADLRRRDADLKGVMDRFENLLKQVTRPGEQAEQLLTTVNARLTRTELTQQQLINSLRDDARAASKNITAEVHADSNKVLRGVTRSTEWEGKRLFRQIEALQALYIDVRPSPALPPTRGWAASPDLLLYLFHTVRNRKPRLVLECGSGASTLVMAYAMRENGAGRVVALEHLEAFRDLAIEWARAHQLEEWIEVRHAPLVDVTIDGRPWTWYSPDALPDGEIDLLFVDGPPEATGPNARFPALPLLADRLSASGFVVLDDYMRDDETNIAERWANQFPDLEMSTLGHEKGTATFEKRGPGDGR